MAQRQEGEGAEYARNPLPVRLLYCEHDVRIENAFRREKQVPGWGRAKRLALVTGELEKLNGLSRKPERLAED